MIKRGLVVAATLGATLAVPGGAAAAPAPSVPDCALGRLPAALENLVPGGIAGAERRFAAGLTGLTGADRRGAREAFAIAEAAYIYGMPEVLLRLTVQRFPLNTMVGVGVLSTPAQRAVVAPNNDTLYSVSQLDLSRGPLILDAPATAGRYSVVQLLDAYTNVVDLVGAGRERDTDRAVALVGPGWAGELPPGVEVVRSSTDFVWLLGRTLVDGPADLAAATDLMKRYALTPVADWVAGSRKAPILLTAPPPGQTAVQVPAGLAFFDRLGADLALDPPPARDQCSLRAFARVGIGPGLTPSTGTDPVVRAALEAATAAGSRLVDRGVAVIRHHSRDRHNGWGLAPPDTGRFATDYANRAIIARSGLGSNTPEEALYPDTDVDRAGRPLHGRRAYVIRFARGHLPPVRAFWSLTLYDRDYFLVDNPIDRYAVGDRTPGLRYGKGRSLTLYVQTRAPSGAKARNWLPAPDGPFSLRLRLYEPKQAAIDGRWEPPTVTPR